MTVFADGSRRFAFANRIVFAFVIGAIISAVYRLVFVTRGITGAPQILFTIGKPIAIIIYGFIIFIKIVTYFFTNVDPLACSIGTIDFTVSIIIISIGTISLILKATFPEICR